MPIEAAGLDCWRVLLPARMQVENEQAASKLAASNPQLGLLLGCYEDKRANCLFTITPWAGDTLNDWVHEYGR